MDHVEENHEAVVEHYDQLWLVPDRPGTGFSYGQKTPRSFH
jgi:hypothetical protein